MKPAAALALTTILTAGLSACGGDSDPADTSDGDGAPGTSLSGAPGADPADVDREADLVAVQTEVAAIAPALESFYRGKPYPRTLTAVRESLDDAGIELPLDSTIGGYAYDEVATEFTLCIEKAAGAWATYDTAPMSLREGTTTGGCPDDLQ